QKEGIDKTFYHGHSYTANPIVCAAANASFSLLMEKECQERIIQITNSHESFRKKVSEYSNVLNARTLGTILALEVKTSSGTSYFNDIRKHISSFFLKRNVLLRPLGNVIYILPPYVINQEELNVVYGHIEDFLTEVSRL